MAVVYSTSDVHPRDSADYWREVVTKDFMRIAMTRDAGMSFQASVSSGAAANLGLSVYEADTFSCVRTARDISRTDSEYYFVCLQLSGRSVHYQDDRHCTVEDGSFFILDPRRPFTGRLEKRGKMLTVRVPRQELEVRAGNAAALASRTLDSRDPVAGLASGFLTMLADRIDALDDAASIKVAEQALDLVTLALAADTDTSVTVSSRRAVTLTLLKSAIEARLHDPELKPASAAAAAGISIRYANALLAQEDTGLERYIIDRRLQRCRRALEDPAQAHRMIGDIAYSWGFSDLSHFGRRFKAEFGCSPGDYRRQHRAGALQPCDAV
jgi:AraC-like DNA-binding protein